MLKIDQTTAILTIIYFNCNAHNAVIMPIRQLNIWMQPSA